jgi:hypothetical protein
MLRSTGEGSNEQADSPLLENESELARLTETINKISQTTAPFQNWGKTLNTAPSRTFYPKSTVDIRNIVTWAKMIGKHIRVSAYKHTWQNVFAQDDDILISLLSLEESKSLPPITRDLDGTSEFQHVELVGDPFVDEDGKTKHLCRIGSATTNEQFRNWSIENFETNRSAYSWALPLNVILVENTFGGTNAMICHGAGIRNPTLPDLLTEIEFVNPKGELQTIGYKITDPVDAQTEGKELIKSAGGSFGQLGVVTNFTFKLDQMTHARMKPSKPRLALTIPPPEGFVIPDFLPRDILRGVTPQQLSQAKEDFFSRVENDYYTEWFWFSLHSHCWVNSWKNDGDERESKSSPSPLEVKIQEIEQYLAFIGSETVYKLLSPEWQARLFSGAAMLLLPAGEEATVPLPDALHFRRGIHNMPVQDMEWQIPIPALANGKPDYSICQRAWWDAIVTVYEWLAKKHRVPMRLPLEMRIMGGSDMTMAAQKGNLGTCSIEILTLSPEVVDKNEWYAFMQAITDKWAAYTDAQGNPLNIRPHWAKQWQGLTVQRKGEARKEIMEYIREVYKEPISTFNRHLDEIAKKGGYTAQDFKLFSVPLLTQVFDETSQPEKMEEEKSSASSLAPAPRRPHGTSDEDMEILKEVMLKTEQVYLAKENFLAEKLGIAPEKVKGRKPFEELAKATGKGISSLIAHSWFLNRMHIAHSNQLLLEGKIKGTQTEPEGTTVCGKPCTIM